MQVSWDDVRLFLEIARAGTLSAAAPRLGMTQPTAGRRLRALELQLQASLFQRTPQGFRLTDEGEAMLLHAERMAEEAQALERKLLGQARGLEGGLRISSSDWFSNQVLAEPLADFAAAHPRVTIELIADWRMLDLERREADMVLRFRPFTGPDIVQRRLTTIRYGLYASQAYLEEHGWSGGGTGAGLRLIAMDEALGQLADVDWMRRHWPEASFALRSNSREAQARACVQGAGLAVLPRVIGDMVPLTLLEVEEAPPSREVWLGYHRDLKRLARLRALVDHLVAAVPGTL
ncbi:LysR family transcriptional regulator [Sphingomonas oligoaromativorans]|uniref:LysR family transcriptional regulator n=1 Tax=Sphingomonas oligoaromativorans TaxID=575322 RepID=UPI001FB9425B|nr:LysR family transcriptional regulator [Sphingomonas oligoaromativorans]NIJ34795.1 DNA-binding transcriptional LysR family regulator [Sphingomonas oligoaromativorans]